VTINEPRKIREQRYDCEVDIKHDVVIPDINYDGIITHLSNEGIYFESNEQISPGDEISVTVKESNDEEITFDVCIIWKKDLSGSHFLFGYGAKSTNSTGIIISTSGQDIKQIPEIEDKRKYQRKIFNKKIRIENLDQCYNGRIRDISRGGAFIETDSSFSVGKKILLNLSGKIAKKRVRLKGWIVRTEKNGFGISFNRRSGVERRYDIDRRKGLDRRNRN
jgi:Tfp pilus assembly protein PilZ